MKAKEIFLSCGEFVPALWQLALLEIRPNPNRAMDYLEQAVSLAKKSATWQDRSGKPSRSLQVIRAALPFFTFDRMVLENAPQLRPLRESPRMRKRFQRMLMP